MYVNSLACVRIRRGESECFKNDSTERQGCIVPLTLFMDAVMGMGIRGVRFLE